MWRRRSSIALSCLPLSKRKRTRRSLIASILANSPLASLKVLSGARNWIRSPRAMVRSSSRKTSTVFGAPPVRHPHREQVCLAINSFNAGVIAFGNRELFASTREADHIAFVVIVGRRALRAREPAIYEDRVLLPDERDMAADDQLRPNRFVQRSSFAGLTTRTRCPDSWAATYSLAICLRRCSMSEPVGPVQSGKLPWRRLARDRFRSDRGRATLHRADGSRLR